MPSKRELEYMRRNTSSRDSWSNKAFGEKSWQGGGGGGSTEYVKWVTIRGGNILRVTPKLLGVSRPTVDNVVGVVGDPEDPGTEIDENTFLPVELPDDININLDTTLEELPAGIGIAQISTGGRVLVAYPNNAGYLACLMLGWRYPVSDSYTLSIPNENPLKPPYTAYIVI